MTVSEHTVRRRVEVGPDFPVAFASPGDVAHAWELDDMHWPHALTPLAAEYVRTLGAGMNDRYDVGDFPQRWRVEIWNGYAYFALVFDGDESAFADVVARWDAYWRDRLDETSAWWRDEALPRLRTLYAQIDEVDVDGLDGAALGEAWLDAWEACRRAWAIHFVAIMCPYQAVEDLADLYERAIPGAPPSEAMTLNQGFNDDLHAVEVDTEALVRAARATPAVGEALRAPNGVTRDGLLAVDGGPDFVARLDAFLADHGHLGQPNDDIIFASWVEEPSLFLAELAKRLDREIPTADARRDLLRAGADEVAARARDRMADRPEDLAAFERLLALARGIGPLTEGHNYWIDRMVQSRLRRLITRVGGRLVADGTIDETGDVFYLEHADITEALAAPRDLRSLVAERRARHAAQATILPPKLVGTEDTSTTGTDDQFDGARIVSEVIGELRGTGGSVGVARGIARVALSPDDFHRIQPGDIIVCPSSNPSWVPVFAIAGGLVTNTGGVISHAAVVAREFGLPAVVGVSDATDLITDGQVIEIDGRSGIVQIR